MSTQQRNDVHERKEFSLSSFSINNSTAVLVIIFLITVLGIQSYVTIPKEAQPDITIPNIMVITLYPGVAPEDMESLVTQKLEDKLNEITSIKKMTSTSTEGYSSINVEFETTVNMDDALQKVREKVDLAKPNLPSSAEDPMIVEINVSEFPIMQVNVSGEYSLDRLKKVAEDLKERIENIPAILEVDIAGGLEREVKVDVNLAKLKYYGLSFGDVIKAIQVENVTIPGGSIDVGDKKFLVRIPGEYKNPALLGDIVVKAPEDRPIYIRDVASIDFGFKDRESYARLDGKPVITLSVKKRVGKNIIEATADVKKAIADQSEYFPPTTTVKITSEMSKDIEAMVANLENSIISGLILVVSVLLFFLGVKNASFVGVSIPLSMFMTFIILSAMGITMNMIVLFSLILALGMLVDNAIVVVENIYRYLEEGYDNIEAAKKGTGEVAIPIISGTLTTLGAFFPLAFWPGIVGEFMGYLPKTLIITLFSSLFIGLVINPVLCALYMTVGENKKASISAKGKRTLQITAAVIWILLFIGNPVFWGMIAGLSAIVVALHLTILNKIAIWWQTEGVNQLIKWYSNSLAWALNYRKSVVLISVMALFLSFVTFGAFFPGVEFFPENIPPSRLYVQVEAPVGTSVEFTDKVIQELEHRIGTMYFVEDLESVVATSGSKVQAGFGGSGSSTHLGTIVLSFKDFEEREHDVFEALEYMRSNLGAGIVGAKVVVEKEQQGPPTGKPINLEIRGKDMVMLEELSNLVKKTFENSSVYQKLEGLESDLPDPRPELRVNVDRELAAKYGLSTNDIGMTVRQAINGAEASEYRDGKDEYDITVRLAEEWRTDLNSIGDLNVMADKGRQVPLSAMATWNIENSFGGINRKNMERVITISADVRTEYNANAVLLEAQQILEEANLSVPRGYRLEWTGQQEEQRAAEEFLSRAFLVALFLIAFILVSQFNSIIKPIIVLSSVIMSTAGVMYGLVFFNMPFVIIMTGIGVISLAGVVVNNAIVLIDYIDVLRQRDKLPLYDALMIAGATRLRPVLLTAITTILGLVPLAIGFNFDFIVLVNNPIEFFVNNHEYIYTGGEQAAWWAPMAIAVIVGLAFATLLTLIVVPVLYSLFESFNNSLRSFFYGEKTEQTADFIASKNGHSAIDAAVFEDEEVFIKS